MYRVSATAPVAGVVRYGPFPLVWWKLAVAPLLWFIGFFADGMADVRLRIDCDAARCEVRSQSWRRPPRSLSGGPGLLLGAEVTEQMKAKDGKLTAHVLVRLEGGGRVRLDREPLAEAQRLAQQVNELAARRATSFRHDSGDKRWLRPVGWALYAAGVLLVVDALRQRRALLLRVGGGVVGVDEPGRWWRRSRRSVAHEGARDVAVVWHQTQAPGPKTPAAWGATLELCLQGGRTVPLTTVPRDGLAAHYEAAAALRGLLGLPAGGPIGALCPGDVYDASKKSSVWMVYLPAVWLGVCCGSIAGMALYGVVSILIDPLSLDRNVDERALVAAAAGAVGLASLMVSIGLAKRREGQTYERLSSGSSSG